MSIFDEVRRKAQQDKARRGNLPPPKPTGPNPDQKELPDVFPVGLGRDFDRPDKPDRPKRSKVITPQVSPEELKQREAAARAKREEAKALSQQKAKVRKFSQLARNPDNWRPIKASEPKED